VLICEEMAEVGMYLIITADRYLGYPVGHDNAPEYPPHGAADTGSEPEDSPQRNQYCDIKPKRIEEKLVDRTVSRNETF
jgi:hypothetical protein